MPPVSVCIILLRLAREDARKKEKTEGVLRTYRRVGVGACVVLIDTANLLVLEEAAVAVVMVVR